ncbi:3-keto-disaccharide hydrolase [Flavitalea flava]
MNIRKSIMTAWIGLAAIAPQLAHSQVAPVNANSVTGGDLAGRWDLTVLDDGKERASWLEIEVSGFSTLVGHFVASGGSARPISRIITDHNKFSFAIPPQWEKVDKDMVLEGETTPEGIKGVIHSSMGQDLTFTGVRAPLLTETKKVQWKKPIQLLNGKDLTGWVVDGDKNQWIVENGELISPHSGSNIITKEKFRDFKLHIEFKYKQASNSGVYLRGRYETQIIDNALTAQPSSHLFGGIYGFLVPSEMAALGPEKWQSFDITLIGRMVTVVANGKTIICNQEIPGITGGALDSREGEPGPIYLQGDHGPVSFRNIVLTPGE